MPEYDVDLLGYKFTVSADTVQKAQGMARLYVARKQMDENVAGYAKKNRAAVDPSYAAYPHLPVGVELDPSTTEGKINNALGIVATGLPVAQAFVAAPLATTATVGAGMVGGEVGEWGGRKIGHAAEALGAPKGTGAVLGAGGMILGGILGGKGGLSGFGALEGKLPSATRAVLTEAQQATIAASRTAREAQAAETVVASRSVPKPGTFGGQKPAWQLEQEAKAAAIEAEAAAPSIARSKSALPPEPSKEYTERLARDLAERRVKLSAYDAEQKAVEEAGYISGMGQGAAPARPVPEPQMIPDDAVAIVADPLPFKPRRKPMPGIVTVPPAPRGGGAAAARAVEPQMLPSDAVSVVAPTPQVAAKADEIAGKILRWKTEDKFSGAQMVSSLRNVYGIEPREGQQMVNMVLEANGLQAPRIQVGAERVGRSVGMTKEEVRQAAGPVLGEARGEASPILPKVPFQKIIDTMKAMPVAEREAYVARATSGKAQWQIENIRRTLEHLGLLLPIGAAAAVTAESKR